MMQARPLRRPCRECCAMSIATFTERHQEQRQEQRQERRLSQRRVLNRIGKIQLGNGTLPRDCLITDISAGGVRLHVENFDVPDEFVLLLSGEGLVGTERVCRVVWRLGHELGAKFVRTIHRPALGGRG